MEKKKGVLIKSLIMEAPKEKAVEENERRELLCAFFKFFRDNGEANIGMTIEQFVDCFLTHNSR